MSDSPNFDATAAALGLNADEPQDNPSNYWALLDGDDLGSAIIDRFTRFREWQSTNGLLRGWRLKLHYYHNEYRANAEIPHLSILQEWGAQGEYQFLSINVLRSLLKTVLSSVIQNPPAFQTRAVNSDADALESAALYQGVLDYYTRELGLAKKIAKAVETGVVVDQGFIMTEWDPFAVDGDSPQQDPTIWKGAPRIVVLSPWDVTYDPMKLSWNELDWVIVRDWVDREKLKSQFPELEQDIDSCRLRSEVVHSNQEYEGSTRYQLSIFPEISNDVQVFKLFHKSQAYMPGGRYVMALETGKLLFESPAGLVYPKLPVERFVCDDQVDILLGYSPINELLGPQESVNSLVSAITTNANNFANQYVAVVAGTDLNPRTLSDGGMKLLEYPPGSNPPTGLNLTAIPPTLFEHLKDLMSFMQTIPGVSNASRGQAPGANSTGSAMLFLSGQTTANQGQMSQNYSDFSAAVMTSLLHVLRTFARTQKTINIMGKTVASKTIVLADALKDFDEVVVDLTNPILSTPQGRLGFAQQMMQFGNSTPQQALEVAVSGNLGPATDPTREQQYELQSENEWLLDGEQVLVNALDDHNAHIMMHTRLFATPWLRKPDLASKLGLTNAPTIMSTIQQHIQQHMQFLSSNQSNQIATTAGQPPGAPPQPNLPPMGHNPPAPPPSPAAPQNAPAQGGAVQDHTSLPAQPNMPKAGGNVPPPH
jgi:hypothetical protein